MIKKFKIFEDVKYYNVGDIIYSLGFYIVLKDGKRDTYTGSGVRVYDVDNDKIENFFQLITSAKINNLLTSTIVELIEIANKKGFDEVLDVWFSQLIKLPNKIIEKYPELYDRFLLIKQANKYNI